MKSFVINCFSLFVVALMFISVSDVNAQTYSGVAVCQTCHSNANIGGIQYTQWQGTLHAVAYDSVAVIQNNPNCLPCHTTGWNTQLANGGFDDFYPPATANDSTKVQQLKNVQCESCHGPVQLGVNHGMESTINFTAERCGECHQAAHHPYYGEWLMAKHSISDTNASAFLTTSFRTNPECTGCHTYQGFMEWVVDTSLSPNVQNPPGDAAQPIVCAACHDPHLKANEGQLRLPPEQLCQKCHNPEFSADSPTPTGEALHHTTAFMFEGKGGYEYPGFTYESSLHKLVITKKCVECHVVMSPFVSDSIPASTGHTFYPKGQKCFECHSDFDTLAMSFDYRGVQTEIDSLLTELGTKLAAATSADSAGDPFKRAKFNYDFVEAEGSHGIHNTKYARGLLVSAIQNFTPSTGVEQTGGDVPYIYALRQNYPNPFNPTTTINFSIASKGAVRLQVYDILGKLVKTIVDREFEPGNYKATWDGTDQSNIQVSSGIYLYKLNAGTFTSTRKMLLVK